MRPSRPWVISSEALATYRLVAPDHRGEAQTLALIGHVQLAREDHEGALAYFEQSLQLSQADGPTSTRTCVTLNNLGVARRALGEIDLAISFFQQEPLASRAPPPSRWPARVASNLGAA